MTLFKVQIISALTESVDTSTSSKVCWPSATELVGYSMTIWGALFFGKKKLFFFDRISLCFFPLVWSVNAERPLKDNSIVLWHTEHFAFVSSFSLRSQPENSGSESQDSTKRLWFLSSFYCFPLLMLIILLLNITKL